MESTRSDVDNIATMEKVALDQLTNFGSGEVAVPNVTGNPTLSEDNYPAVNSAEESPELKSGNIWLCMTRQPKETDDVVQSKYFEIEVCLVDKAGRVVRDVVNKLQLQVLLLYEDLTWVDQQSLIEVDPKTPAVIDRDGYARMRVRIMDISRVHSRRKFVVYVAAANENLTLGVALSRPLFVLSRKSKRAKPGVTEAAKPPAKSGFEPSLVKEFEGEPVLKSLLTATTPLPQLPGKHTIDAELPQGKRIKAEPVDVKLDMQQPSEAVSMFLASFALLPTEDERRAALSALAQQMTNDDLKCVVCEFLSRPDKL